MTLRCGTGRVCLNPPWGVELTGWGYYLHRTWQRVHDSLQATALAMDNGHCAFILVSCDLMVISEEFTAAVRRQVQAATGLGPQHVLVCCTHTHNAPASGGLLGVGEVDREYETWAARQAATAAILAWRGREPCQASASSEMLPGLTYNRTRVGGPVDATLTSLHVRRPDGSPLAVVVGFQAHPTVTTTLRPFEVSRDVPGHVCDLIESALPGCTAIHIQGACGDVNFLPEFTTPTRWEEPGRRIADAVLHRAESLDTLDSSVMAVRSQLVRIPTRRWTRAEIDGDRNEALSRLRDRDLSNWRDTIGRVMTNRPDDMVARHGGDEWKAVAAMCRFNLEWTDRMLQDLGSRPEWIETEVQAFRIGQFGIVSNASEFFTTLALDVRARSPLKHLMLACYANGRIGYVPDAHDIERKTYAAWQSPKYCNQFPFTINSGPQLAQSMLDL